MAIPGPHLADLGPQPGNLPVLAPAGSGSQRWPPPKAHLDYAKTLIEVVLLLLAVPWILRELVRRPGQVSRRAAAKHLGGTP